MAPVHLVGVVEGRCPFCEAKIYFGTRKDNGRFAVAHLSPHCTEFTEMSGTEYIDAVRRCVDDQTDPTDQSKAAADTVSAADKVWN